MWNLSGILNIYLMNHHLKDHQSQSPFLYMVKKVIFKIKFSKAVGLSGVLVENIREAVDTGATMIRDLMGRSQLTGSRALLSAFTRERVICSGQMQL